MREEDKTLYINGIEQQNDIDSTVYIGNEQTSVDDDKTICVFNENKDNLKAENTVYVGESRDDNNEIISDEKEDLNRETGPIGSNIQLHGVDTVSNKHENLTDVNDDSNRVGEQEQSVVNKNWDNDVEYHLPQNTMLQKRYRINSVLGEGGFGITYSGWDVTLNIPIAIKEYYPSGLVTRSVTLGKTTQVIPVSTAKYETQFRDGIDRVLDEARRMAKFRNMPGIVGIYDFFKANNTAYIVMEYIEGVTLDVYCKKNNMDNTTLFNMLVPIMDALQSLHNEGIIHRDISPDNIMVDKEGNFKLLDFGAARGYSEENATTMSVILKKSYAPEEQFRTKGKQGPWTDVYALGATIYELITGTTPPTSIDRLVEDEIVDIRDLAPSLTKGQAEAIMIALAVRQKDRWQSIGEFKLALLQASGSIVKSDESQKQKEHEENPNTIKNSKFTFSDIILWIKKNRKLCVIFLLAIVLVTGTITTMKYKKNNKEPGYLGVYSSDVPDDIKEEYGVENGTYITGVEANTPAAKAGLVEGDILTFIDDNALSGMDDFSDIITRYYSGDKVKVKYLHISKAGEYLEKSIIVKLSNRNEEESYSYTISDISPAEEQQEETKNISSNGNLRAHLDSVSHQLSSYFAYIEFTNETDKDVTIKSKNIYLNDIPVDSGGTRKLGVVPANSTLILSSYVSLEPIINKGIENIESFRIVCYFDENEDSIFNIEENNLSIKIDYREDDLEKVLSNKESKESQVDDTKRVVENGDTNKVVDIHEVFSSEIPENVKIEYTTTKNSNMYITFNFLATNEGEEEVYLGLKGYQYADGVCVDSTTSGAGSILPGKAIPIECTFNWDDLKSAEADPIHYLMFQVYLKSNKDDEDYLSEFVYCLKYDEELSTWEKCSLDDILSHTVDKIVNYDFSGVKNIVLDNYDLDVKYTMQKNSSAYTHFYFTIKNNGDKAVFVNINGENYIGNVLVPCTVTGYHLVQPGLYTVLDCYYSWDKIHAAGFDEISVIDFEMSARDDKESEERSTFSYSIELNDSKDAWIYKE